MKNVIEKGKQQSIKDLSIKATIRQYHLNRIDQLLNSNDLRRVPVASDGNCFFSAVKRSAGTNKDLLSFKKRHVTI